ncbi:MAG: hypothetical protein BMS9Abin08_0945 [Gammaproteobacteria bacterium]|nr:MAG: hypothetical protein BMS9Abin08_0945 [Gammaproteobacteria bacterium]
MSLDNLVGINLEKITPDATQDAASGGASGARSAGRPDRAVFQEEAARLWRWKRNSGWGPRRRMATAQGIGIGCERPLDLVKKGVYIFYTRLYA